jgi:uncharacterized protein with von Willebrand factor type A (vWA) domain
VDELIDDVAAFGRLLRAEGLGVEPTRLADFARAQALASPTHAYWIGRATLLGRQEDAAAYDRAFEAHYGGAARRDPEPAAGSDPEPEARARAPEGGPDGRGAERAAGGEPAPGSGHDDQEPGAGGRGGGMARGAAGSDELGEARAGPASAVERLRHKRFEDCTEEELDQLRTLLARITWTLPPRRTRRRRRSRRGELDVQETLRAALRSDGEAIVLHRRERRLERRRLVLVLDVSNSMAAHSRALLMFAHAALGADATWEAFCFATRMTRLSEALRGGHRPDDALRAATAAAGDWGGGTRIGASLRALLDEWSHTRVLRGAVVVICSDGLEVGDPTLLAEEMARLSRLAAEVVWLNPLKGLEGYEPLARGMRAALPYVDVFSSGDDLASLEQLARHFTADPRGPGPRTAAPARGSAGAR